MHNDCSSIQVYKLRSRILLIRVRNYHFCLLYHLKIIVTKRQYFFTADVHLFQMLASSIILSFLWISSIFSTPIPNVEKVSNGILSTLDLLIQNPSPKLLNYLSHSASSFEKSFLQKEWKTFGHQLVQKFKPKLNRILYQNRAFPEHLITIAWIKHSLQFVLKHFKNYHTNLHLRKRYEMRS